jgi:hypothetical protein
MYALKDAQPMQAGERISDMIGALQGRPTHGRNLESKALQLEYHLFDCGFTYILLFNYAF